MNSKKYINLLKNDKKELLEIIDELKNRIDKAIEKLYCWGEVLDSDFQKEMLCILKGKYDEKNNK